MYARGCLLLASALLAAGQQLSDSQLAAVLNNMNNNAKQPWEIGTRAETLTELSTPSFSVMNKTSLPPPTTAPGSFSAVLGIAHDLIANRSTANNHTTGPQPFVMDASAADPASSGVAVLLANWTGQGASDGLDYAGAATDQINFLYTKVPRASDGALSHRTDQTQLWSDFVYMVPPFLAYYGVTTANQSWLAEAYHQISLYRDNLHDDSAGGLWKHVVLGKYQNDEGHWSTGNGWAAAGMLRVLGTIANSAYAGALQSEQDDLKGWVNEIHTGMYAHLGSDGLFTNYADDNSTFKDASSAALLAATVYRLALLSSTSTYIPQAELSRTALSTVAKNGSFAHFDSSAWLTPVVNPYEYGNEGAQSPEGQAFVGLMQAAYADWVKAGSPGKKSAATRVAGAGGAGVVVALAVVAALWVA